MILSNIEHKIINTAATKRESCKVKIKEGEIKAILYLNEEKCKYSIPVEIYLEGLKQANLIDGYSRDLSKVFHSCEDDIGITREREDYVEDFAPEYSEWFVWAADWYIKSKVGLWAFDLDQLAKNVLNKYIQPSESNVNEQNLLTSKNAA